MAGSQTNVANSFNGLYESDNAGHKNFYTMAIGSQKNSGTFMPPMIPMSSRVETQKYTK
jgi:hypothetical protein